MGVRVVFLLDCSLILSLLKHRGVGAFLNQKIRILNRRSSLNSSINKLHKKYIYIYIYIHIYILLSFSHLSILPIKSSPLLLTNITHKANPYKKQLNHHYKPSKTPRPTTIDPTKHQDPSPSTQQTTKNHPKNPYQTHKT